MTKNHHISPFLFSIIDFFLLTSAFFALNYVKRGTLELSFLYVKLLLAFYVLWLAVSLFTKKFRFDFSRGYGALMLNLARSTLYFIYCVSLMVVLMGLHGFSRLHVFGTCGLFYIGEVISYSLWYMLHRRAETTYAGMHHAKIKIKTKTLLVVSVGDFLLVTGIFFLVNYITRGTFILSPDYEKLLLIIYGLWLFTAFMTKKFDAGYRNYYFAMAQWAKAVIFMAASMAVLIFAFRMFYYSRGQILGFFALLILAEAILNSAYYVRNVEGEDEGDIESIDEVKGAQTQKHLPFDIDIAALRARLTRPVREKLQQVYLDTPELFEFIDEALDLNSIITAETNAIHSSEMFNLATLDERPIRLFINTGLINNIRWINRYFLEVHKFLLPSGYFVGVVKNTAMCKKRFFKNIRNIFPHFFMVIILFLDV